MVRLTYDEIENDHCLPVQSHPHSGATVLFLGTARELTAGRTTQALEYDAYPEMATRVLTEIEQQACRQWPIIECEIIHRLGRVAIGATCVVVRVVSGHRTDAFAAAAWIMDCIKQRVPIWKCEHWSDGPPQWVYPDSPPEIPKTGGRP